PKKYDAPPGRVCRRLAPSARDHGRPRRAVARARPHRHHPTAARRLRLRRGLAPDLGDPDDARAEQLSSEALNILLALRDTTVAVVSRRDPEQVAQLMRLSGAKGG